MPSNSQCIAKSCSLFVLSVSSGIVTDQPEPRFFIFAGLDALVGVAKSAIGGSIGYAALDDLANRKYRKCEHDSLRQGAIAAGR